MVGMERFWVNQDRYAYLAEVSGIMGLEWERKNTSMERRGAATRTFDVRVEGRALTKVSPMFGSVMSEY